MSLSNTYDIVVEELSILKTSKTKPLTDAIEGLRKIEFYYRGPIKPKRKSVKAGKRYKVEPFAIGPSKKGNLILRAWIEPPSTSKSGFEKTKWRTFKISRMSDIKILDDTFEKRPGFNENNADGSMDTVYISADFSKTPKRIRKQKPPAPAKPKPEPKVVQKEPEEPKDKEELPQPKPKDKPEPPENIQEPKPEEPSEPEKEIEPEIEPQPQDNTNEPEGINPDEEEEDKNLQENIKRIKTLMFF